MLLVLFAAAGLLGAGTAGDGAAAPVRDPATALWATTAAIEAVLPAKLETAFDRSALGSSSKQGPALAVLVLAVLLACAAARQASVPAEVPLDAAVRSLTLPERGPPLRRIVLA